MGFYLKQLDDSNLMFQGKFEYSVGKEKKVVVDGEVYKKQWREQEEYTADMIYEMSLFGSMSILKYNFQELDYVINVKNTAGDPFKGKLSFNDTHTLVFSQNHFAEVALFIDKSAFCKYTPEFFKIKIDERIKGIYTCKTRNDYFYFANNILDRNIDDAYWFNKSLKKSPFINDLLKGEVHFQLSEYGGNNSVFYYISAVDYCQLPYKQIEGKGLEILQRLGWYGKRENELKNAMRIFEEKIKNPELC